MSKYDKLGVHLERQPGEEVPMTFAEIENVIGCKLPRSARYPAWWSNNPSNNVMTRVWLDAGFKTEQVNIESRKLVFRRVAATEGRRQREGVPSMMHPQHPPHSQGMSDVVRAFAGEPGKGGAGTSAFVHPAFGSMKGLVTIMPGVDLTEPADADWGKLAEKKYGKRGKLP